MCIQTGPVIILIPDPVKGECQPAGNHPDMAGHTIVISCRHFRYYATAVLFRTQSTGFHKRSSKD